MKTEGRRSFVRKSLATSMTLTFSGLIRAHGSEGGETTTCDPDETTVVTTYDTTDSGGTTTWDPDQSTVPEETTFATTMPEETTWDPDETTVPEETTLLSTADTTEVEPERRELISIEIKILDEHTELSGQSWPDTEQGKKDAIKKGMLKLGELIEFCETRNPHEGPVAGMVPCTEIEPVEGPNAELVTTEIIDGRVHYKIVIPGGGIFYKFIFWKPAS